MAQYKIISTKSEFKEIKSQWKELYKVLNNTTVFQSYEWNYNWWENIHQKDKLFVLIFFEKNMKSINAIFPLYIDSKKILRFIADKHTDYSSFLVIDMGNSDLDDLLKTFYKVILEESKISAIELKNMKVENISLGLLDFYFDYKKIIYQSNAYSYTKLKGNEEFFQCFTHLKSSQRSELKRVYKKNKKYESRIYNNLKMPLPIERIKKLMMKMVENSTRGEAFIDEKLLATIDALYTNGYLLIHEVYEHDKSIAMNFILQKDDQYTFWIDIYDDYRFINIYAYLKFMEKVCINSIDIESVFDFGRGLYDYKIKNFFPVLKPQITFFYSKKSSIYILYLLKLFVKLVVKNFYKKNKVIINKILGRS